MIGRQSPIHENLMRPLYSFAEADLLAGVTRGTSSRWLKGYRYWYTPEELRARPPVTPEPAPKEAVSFVDFVEVVIIGRLREEGFSLRRIRQINEYCQLALRAPRPLVTERFRTDGRDVFAPPDWSWAQEDGTFGNRFDDPGKYRGIPEEDRFRVSTARLSGPGHSGRR